MMVANLSIGQLRLTVRLASTFLLVGLGSYSAALSPITPAPTTAPSARSVRVPSGAELLAKLRSVDAAYRKGFTAAGTDVSGWPRTNHEWQLTMGGGRTALVCRALEILDQAENKPIPEEMEFAPGGFVLPTVAIETAVFMTPQFCMHSFLQKRPPVTLNGQGGYRIVEFSPRQPTLDAGRVLWVLGRGLSEEIEKITQVRRELDGTLVVTAIGAVEGKACELHIDPKADYLVRSGKGFYYYSFGNTGVQWIGKLCIPLEGTWGGDAKPRRLTFRSASAKVDRNLLKTVEAMMHAPYPPRAGTHAIDFRLWPMLSVDYEGSQVVAPIRAHEPSPKFPDAVQKLREQQAGPRRTAEQFLAAALAGRDKEVAALAAPGSAAGQLGALRKTARGAKVDVKEVFLAGSIALVTTSDVSDESDAGVKGPLLLRLTKHQDDWLVDRIDMRVTEPITRRVTDALIKEPPQFPGML